MEDRMTPNARRWAEFIAKGKAKDMHDPHGVIKEIVRCKYFEVTDIIGLASEMAGDLGCRPDVDLDQDEQLLTRAFLPHDPVWIEWREAETEFGKVSGRSIMLHMGHMTDPSGKREEVILMHWFFWRDGKPVVVCIGGIPTSAKDGLRSFVGSGDDQRIHQYVQRAEDFVIATAGQIVVLLSIINTPKIFKLVEHKPSRLLHEKLRKSKPLMQVKPYQLLPWSVIKLELTVDKTAQPSGTITGMSKCLHYCRAHLRLWNGKLIHVKGHYRGTATKGIKRSIYEASL
jgi:hypothetical protein